ncbi:MULTISPECIES: hypothetical protein [unclassified Streptomyces]|uniref:hypothetical protein n=1 Tax=unclassified Streptomyces TaxID=2593676 RepID=UPI0033E089ED
MLVPSLMPVAAFRRCGMAAAKDSTVSELIERAEVKYRAAILSTGTQSVVLPNCPPG